MPEAAVEKRPLKYRWLIVAGCSLGVLVSIVVALVMATATTRACMADGSAPSAAGWLSIIMPLITGGLSAAGGITGILYRVVGAMPDSQVKSIAVKLLPVGRLSEIKHTFDSATSKDERDASRSLAEIAVKNLMVEWFPPDTPTP